MGETTLEAAKREVMEETHIQGCRWHPRPFMTTDAIFKEKNGDSYLFHYVISHCFAIVEGENAHVTPSDDALDARWLTYSDINEMKDSQKLSEGVLHVIDRVEELIRVDALRVH
jgi:ADP-ribose pyrophosphatase YjhB (NUDIX family)